MGYFQVRYDSRVVNYDRRGFIRLATVGSPVLLPRSKPVRHEVEQTTVLLVQSSVQ